MAEVSKTGSPYGRHSISWEILEACNLKPVGTLNCCFFHCRNFRAILHFDLDNGVERPAILEAVKNYLVLAFV